MNFIYFLIFIISFVLALIYFFKFLELVFNKKVDASISDFKYLLLCFIFLGISVFSCFKSFKIEEKMKLEEIKEQKKSKEDYIHRFEAAKNTVIIKSDNINEQKEIINYAESKGYDLKEINGGNILIFRKMIKEW
jgi:hypothetical protein